MSFGEWCIHFEIVYYVLSPDYLKYMDTQQAVCLAIYDSFEKEGISFAHPAQKLMWENE